MAGAGMLSPSMITAYATLKKAAGIANHDGKRLDDQRYKLIVLVCDEFLAGQHRRPPLGLGERVTYWTEIPTAWQNFSSFCGISTSRQQTAQKLNESSAGAKRNSFHPASRAATRPCLLMAHHDIRLECRIWSLLGV
jgi:hypothetical protein